MFSEWEETAVAESTIAFSRDGMRDVYRLKNGIRLYHEVILPRNIFAKQHEQCVVDFEVPISEAQALKKIGAIIDSERYSPDGFGVPCFRGKNSLESAFNYAIAISPKQLKNRKAP